MQVLAVKNAALEAKYESQAEIGLLRAERQSLKDNVARLEAQWDLWSGPEAQQPASRNALRALRQKLRRQQQARRQKEGLSRLRPRRRLQHLRRQQRERPQCLKLRERPQRLKLRRPPARLPKILCSGPTPGLSAGQALRR